MADDGDDDITSRRTGRALGTEARLTFLERDVRDHAKSITALIEDNQARAIADATRAAKDEQRDITLNDIKSLGKFVLGSVSLLIIGEIARVFFHVGM
jgi:hypothetical protein